MNSQLSIKEVLRTRVKKLIELLCNQTQFEALITFLQARCGLGYHTLAVALYPGDGQLSPKQKQRLDESVGRLLELTYNEVLLYVELPMAARMELFRANQLSLKDTKWWLRVDFDTFDQVWMPMLAQLERDMRERPRETLSSIFGGKFTLQQQKMIEQGLLVNEYNQAIHSYRKWLIYYRRTYVLIKQTPTYRPLFRAHLIKRLSRMVDENKTETVKN